MTGLRVLPQSHPAGPGSPLGTYAVRLNCPLTRDEVGAATPQSALGHP
jgi:hypothetical protein